MITAKLIHQIIKKECLYIYFISNIKESNMTVKKKKEKKEKKNIYKLVDKLLAQLAQKNKYLQL